MAETTVGFVTDKMVQLLIEEAEFFRGVHKDILAIVDELQSIRCFLKDADAKAERDESLRVWVKQVTRVSYDLEDAVDAYMLHKTKFKNRNGRCWFLQRAAYAIRRLKMLHQLSSEIQEIKYSIHQIGEKSLRYNFMVSEDRPSGSGSHSSYWEDLRHPDSLLFEEAGLVGVESSREMLTNWVMEGTSERVVIPVFGMGGIGKTTLVKTVYNSQTIKGSFDCCAWIHVSQSYKTNVLLSNMINQLSKETDKSASSNEIEAMEMRNLLQKKRYLVVLDDLWNIDFWRTMNHVLPDNGNGSRIIITTRMEDVAYSCIDSSSDRVFKLGPLPPEDAWELFCKKAFRFEFGGHCPPELEELSYRIVERCGGLPLAIVAVGGLAWTREKTVSEWAKLCRSLYVELESNPYLTSLKQIFLMNYDDLPYYLKCCFLYLGIFPEDYSISCNRLIKLWIAEGFVKERRGLTLEEVAQEYLNALIQRSLVYVSKVNFAGKARSCRVHALMLDLILSKSWELGFSQVFSEEDSRFAESARRLSIHHSTYVATSRPENPVVRSVFLFNLDDLPSSFLNTIFTTYKLLNVLDFKDAPLDCIPKEVGKLFHLRYLSIRGTKVDKLPKSIGKLQNLETLDLKHSLVRKLPTQINKLHKLRHLLACIFDYEIESGGVKVGEGISCLKALQKLYYIEANHGVGGLLQELGFLRQLKKLGIVKLTQENCVALCSSIDQMYNLQSLRAYSRSEDEILDLQLISSPPPLLQHLRLKGRLIKLPQWIASLHNLVSIHLISSMLHDFPLEVLQHLPNLLMLWLNKAYIGEELYFGAGSFRKLKILRLNGLENLKSLRIDKGALSLLEDLNIGPSLQLDEVPSGIQYLENLTSLAFDDMPEEFLSSMLPDKGQDYWKVRHIPAVKSTGLYSCDLRDPNRLKLLYS